MGSVRKAGGDALDEPGRPGNGIGKAKGRAGNDREPDLTVTSAAQLIVKLNPYRYAGYRYDRETELYLLISRYYDPWSNRFISRDNLIGELDRPLTLNRYIYALNNPLGYVDPTGHTPMDWVRYVVRYHETMIRLSNRYNLPPDLIVSVLWNENKWRWGIHQAKDVAGMMWKGEASLGICQVQIATAALLDSNPDPASLRGIEDKDFERLKHEALDKYPNRANLANLLLNPETNLEYAIRYLALIK